MEKPRRGRHRLPRRLSHEQAYCDARRHDPLAQDGERGAGAGRSMVMASARVVGGSVRRGSNEPLLTLRGFGIAYGERRIINSIELDIRAGVSSW
jgi:hypothetical protein